MSDILETQMVQVPRAKKAILGYEQYNKLVVYEPRVYQLRASYYLNSPKVNFMRSSNYELISKIENVVFANNIQKELTQEAYRIMNSCLHSDRLGKLKLDQSADDEIVFYYKTKKGTSNLIIGDDNDDVTYGFVGNRPGDFSVKYLGDDFNNLGALVNHFMIG